MSEPTKRLDKLLNVKQVSQILSVKASTIYWWCRIGFIPHRKIGHLTRFSEREVYKWLEKMEHCEGRRNPIPTIDLQSGIRKIEEEKIGK